MGTQNSAFQDFGWYRLGLTVAKNEKNSGPSYANPARATSNSRCFPGCVLMWIIPILGYRLVSEVHGVCPVENHFNLFLLRFFLVV